MALARTPHKGTWRMWAICCEGIGPISTRVYVSRGSALIAKQLNYPLNPLYQVRRVKVVPDPEKRRASSTSTAEHGK